MPTGLKRLRHSGQSHFLTFSCYHRLPFLQQMSMEEDFLCALERVRLRFRLRVYGYVVMPEHVHLLLSEPELGSLSKAIQLLKTRVSIKARKAGERAVGGVPFWQKRYFDHNVRNEPGFVMQLRYIHRNPVKRSLCACPEQWPWSSFLAWAEGKAGPVEIENEWTARERELAGVYRPPTLSAETSGKDGARIIGSH